MGDNPTPPSVQLVGDVKYVCLALGGAYRDVSLLMTYECTGSYLCPSTTASIRSQLELSCIDGIWSATVFGTKEEERDGRREGGK